MTVRVTDDPRPGLPSWREHSTRYYDLSARCENYLFLDPFIWANVFVSSLAALAAPSQWTPFLALPKPA